MKAEQYIKSLIHLPLVQINREIEQVCGIINFFNEEEDIDIDLSTTREDKDEYGDWQTNAQLAHIATSRLSKDCSPQIILEPTCGTGNFILASLDTFTSIEEVYAVEIYKPYLQILKFEILQRYLDGIYTKPVRFHLIHSSVFDVDWDKIKKQIAQRNLLVIGNPPWVTNSDLSSIDSSNLPIKSNFRQERGFDALTGKSNFDIAEYICYDMFRHFANDHNQFALLLKNSVIKQICYSQRKIPRNIASMCQYQFDAKREFGASVDASLFVCKSGQAERCCDVMDLYTGEYCRSFGWIKDKFVSDLQSYSHTSAIDGVSPFKWWSGIKHDCQTVVELKRCGDTYVNRLGEVVDIEEDSIYPYVKSSDIQYDITPNHKRFIIITQHSISDNTDQLQITAPRTYTYLMQHREYFEKRKSVIYKKRSLFSMFGIGDYTFKPYKIVISGLYKQPHFALLTPINGKCVIPDDTCYLLGFDSEDIAKVVLSILSSDIITNFIKSISFADTKRIITKDVLMRINILNAIPESVDKHTLITYLDKKCNQTLLIF